jgi:hypothetical protein
LASAKRFTTRNTYCNIGEKLSVTLKKMRCGTLKGGEVKSTSKICVQCQVTIALFEVKNGNVSD